MNRTKHKHTGRRRRHGRVRKRVQGTADRPRLAVFRSNRHIIAQVIDDRAGVTLAAASTLEAGFDGATGNTDAATKVGQATGRAGQGRRRRTRSCSTAVGSSITAASRPSLTPPVRADWSSDDGSRQRSPQPGPR